MTMTTMNQRDPASSSGLGKHHAHSGRRAWAGAYPIAGLGRALMLEAAQAIQEQDNRGVGGDAIARAVVFVELLLYARCIGATVSICGHGIRCVPGAQQSRTSDT